MKTVKSNKMVRVKIAELAELVNKLNSILDNSLCEDDETITISKNEWIGIKKIAIGMGDTFKEQIHPEELESPVDMSFEISIKRRDGSSELYVVVIERSDNSRGWVLKSVKNAADNYDYTEDYYSDDMFRKIVDDEINRELIN